MTNGCRYIIAVASPRDGAIENQRLIKLGRANNDVINLGSSAGNYSRKIER